MNEIPNPTSTKLINITFIPNNGMVPKSVADLIVKYNEMHSPYAYAIYKEWKV